MVLCKLLNFIIIVVWTIIVLKLMDHIIIIIIIMARNIGGHYAHVRAVVVPKHSTLVDLNFRGTLRCISLAF